MIRPMKRFHSTAPTSTDPLLHVSSAHLPGVPLSPGRGDAGFTLLELTVTIAIIAILASIATPMYGSALQTARIEKARAEIRMMSSRIDAYRRENQDALPPTLADVGYGDHLDPWGNPYLYLNFQTGSGSAMELGLEYGLIDPEAIPPPAPTAQRIGLIRTVLNLLDLAPADRVEVETARDEIADRVEPVQRKDKFLFPLNSDYDLFSLGINGITKVALGHFESLDDVIRANDGGYFGLASHY